jgi:predicted GTPase
MIPNKKKVVSKKSNISNDDLLKLKNQYLGSQNSNNLFNCYNSNNNNNTDKCVKNNKVVFDLPSDDEADSSDDESMSIRPEPPCVPIDNINLCFVGGVSTGKSTILNAIFCEELTQCKIKRTTMVPTVYIENDNNAKNLTSPELIFTTISDKNKEIITKTETGKKLNRSQ